MASQISARDEMIPIALNWVREGRAIALATVIETWGSAPRPVGSQLVIDADGRMEGSVSGGCVEGAVVLEAQEAIENGASRVLNYGVSDDDAFAVGLACGGTIRILVEPVGSAMPVAMLETLAQHINAREPVAYVVDLNNGNRRFAGPEEYSDRFRLDQSGLDEGGYQFVAIYNPPLRMMVIGAVHIAQALCPMARLAGYDVTVIDPRPAFAADQRFPDDRIMTDWPDDALERLGIDTRTAIVTLTHDPKIDDPALEIALKSKAFYIGSLGSKRTHAKRLDRLRDNGFAQEELQRIHGPIGLNIGGRSPAEIAISILAEVTDVLRHRPD